MKSLFAIALVFLVPASLYADIDRCLGRCDKKFRGKAEKTFNACQAACKKKYPNSAQKPDDKPAVEQAPPHSATVEETDAKNRPAQPSAANPPNASAKMDSA